MWLEVYLKGFALQLESEEPVANETRSVAQLEHTWTQCRGF